MTINIKYYLTFTHKNFTDIKKTTNTVPQPKQATDCCLHITKKI